MSFISWQYLLFLPLVVLLYWRINHAGRILLLVIANYIFYGLWDARFVALLLTSTVVDFYCGLSLVGQRERTAKVLLMASLPAAWLIGFRALTPSGGAGVEDSLIYGSLALPVVWGVVYNSLWHFTGTGQRRAFMLLSVVTNLGVLGFFKYANFFSDSLVSLLSGIGWQAGWTLPHIILPIAISFYTFQSICYSVDIYKGKGEPIREFLPFAAYLSFFPQLIAGPIERPKDLIPQFLKPAAWRADDMRMGIRLILTGFFKKVFVADNCALLANYAFATGTAAPNGYWAVLGVVAFAFQIYGDFSGYTDIARGSARLMGIHLSTNFSFPYFAKNPSEFWRRWHITLSTWFRDYVYIPLGGNRGGAWKSYRNLGITMLLAGIWHGANWKFALWGAYHGALLIAFHASAPWKRLSESATQSVFGKAFWVGSMWVLTLVGWSIFRSEDMTQLGGWFMALTNWDAAAGIDFVRPSLWLLFHVMPLLLLQLGTLKHRDEAEMGTFHWAVRGTVYVVLFLFVATSMVNDQEFLYFQF